MLKKTVVGICGGPSCCQVNQKLWKLSEDLDPEVFKVEEAQCLGLCEQSPNIRIDDPTTGERVKHEGVDGEKWDIIIN
ncbi:MAG TPA: hypothetical protein VIT68_04305 [Candidatus Gracilibacteria bacterium]